MVNHIRIKADLTVARVGHLHIGFKLEAVQEVLMGTSSADLQVAGSFTVVPDPDGGPVVKEFDGSAAVSSLP